LQPVLQAWISDSAFPAQVPLVEAGGQQFGDGEGGLQPVRAADMDRRLGIGELGDALATAPSSARIAAPTLNLE
jgi:hypothetical protein